MKRLFAVILCVPSVLSYAQNGMGVGNNNPQELLDVSGAIKIGGTLQGAADAGSIRWNGTNFQGYDGTQWVNLDSQGGADSDWTVSGTDQYSAVSGNVGIGSSTPGAKLEVAGQVKITGGTPGANKVLTSDATGLATWVDPNTLVSADSDWTVSGSNVYSAVAGNVGIGTNNPQKRLHLTDNASSGLNLPVLLQNSTASNNSGAGIGIGFVSHGASSLPKAAIFNERVTDFGLGKLHILMNNVSDATEVTLSDSRVTVLSNGNVGIGTSTPAVKLDVAGRIALNDNQLRLRAGSDGNHYLAHLGGSFDGPLLQGLSTVVLKTGTYGDASGVFLRNNRVGIGIANPTNGLLHVEGFHDVNFGYQYFNSGGGTGWCSSCNSAISIWAQHRIATSELNVFSDARIKDVIGVSNGGEDLSTLMEIEVTDYTYKDKIGRGNSVFKKVVAQQLEDIYPEAVSKTTNTIPDIYQLATIRNGVLTLPEVKVMEGEKLKLITKNGSEEMVTVESVSEEGIHTSTDLSGEVFVYGREVDDFRTVDYEAVSMLNVSATQELYKLIQNLKGENLQLKSEVESLSSLKAEIEKLKTWTKFEEQSNK